MVTFEDWLASLDLLAGDLDAVHITETGSGHDVYLYAPALVASTPFAGSSTRFAEGLSCNPNGPSRNMPRDSKRLGSANACASR